MQSMKYLSKCLSTWLDQNTNYQLFTLGDLRALYPSISDNAFKTLLSRAVNTELLVRVCRGVYLYKRGALPMDGLILFRVAALLRVSDFNYISLETVLSYHGVISQIPINYISIMSSGRSNSIDCSSFGTIEFVHTSKKPADIVHQLIYNHDCGLWQANIKLALQDMKNTHRNCDLIDWSVVDELI